jgi:hypothetical protein
LKEEKKKKKGERNTATDHHTHAYYSTKFMEGNLKSPLTEDKSEIQRSKQMR